MQQTNDERSEYRTDTPQLAAGSFIICMLRDGVKLMEIIFCVKRDTRTVLVPYKYGPFFRDFVGDMF